MKKSLLLTAAFLLLVATDIFAWSTVLTGDTIKLEGYKLFKDIDFYNGTVNGEVFGQGDGCFVINPDSPAEFKLNGFNAFQVENPGLEFMYVSIGLENSLNARSGVNKDGLHNYGSGDRCFAFTGMQKDQIVVVQGGLFDANREWKIYAPTNSGDGACTYEEITSEVHAAQTAAGQTADNFYYFRMTSDGRAEFMLGRGCCIQAMQILIDASNETVTAPVVTLVAVDGASRVVTINPGISTMGNDVETYYTFDGSDVFETTLDTDQLLYCDTIYGSDYPADPDDYELDPHYAEIVMKDDDGQWLSNGFLFEPSEPEIFVDAIYDDDNDGFVTVKVATVSTTGIASSTTSVRLNIGEITLNAPTLTLVGLNDEYRTYQLGWVNNTLCKETYQITASVDDGYSYAYTIGERMEAKDRIVVTVSAEGYNDGVLELDELPCEGEKFYRKNAAKAAEGLHDYDFRSDYMDAAVLERARGEYVSRAYIISHSDTTYVGGETVITNDTTWYTREQYLSGEAADATPVYEGYWNWAYDAAKSRTWLDTYTDTLTTDSTVVVTPYYREDLAGVWGDGCEISATFTAANGGGIALYTNNLGIYFMTKGIVTLTNVYVGEYVVMHMGWGGSNYITTEYDICEEVTALGTGPCTYTYNYAEMSRFLQYIDVYTNGDIPIGIQPAQDDASDAPSVVYDLTGRRVAHPSKGIYIMNGKKVWVK
ncbi:MAG: hypothetical protein J5814_07050 [Bacteroidaceae bacterium]|nr:hypothetical protein [Bacteroidaceae bacterium]